MGREEMSKFYVEIRYFVLYPVIPHRRFWRVGQAPEAVEINAVLYVLGSHIFQKGRD